MVTIQRVRVRWTTAERGATHANARRGLYRPVALPDSLPSADVLVHDVLADVATDYARTEQVLAGGPEQPRTVGLWLDFRDRTLAVDRLPGSAAYPRPAPSVRLFTLAPGQVGRYRANFRFTGCACDPSWWYEDWLIHVSNGLVSPDRFLHTRPDREVDQRVHLYGGQAPIAARRRRASASTR